MSQYSLHPQTHIGTVALTVADLNRSLAYYQNHIGLRLHGYDNGTAQLGVGGPDLLHLTEQPGAIPASQRTGLYHFALLVPSRRDLATVLYHFAQAQTPIDGMSDHLVSEALYLTDPDGHGIEVYADRPRDQWPMNNGQLTMDTLRLNVDDLMATLTKEPVWEGLPAGSTMGHIHLHIRNVTEAETFYRTLGLDLMLRYGPTASFMSAGGYHHHLGLNTWAGVGAPPPDPQHAQLQWFQLCLPNQAALDDVVARLEPAGFPHQQLDDGTITLRDPSHNQIHLTIVS